MWIHVSFPSNLLIILELDPSRRDDIESLLYVVLFLYYGQLPWHKKAQTMVARERLDYVIRMKQELPIESYGHKIPCKYQNLENY